MLEEKELQIRKVEKVLTAISWIVAMVITVLIVADVLLRFVFNKPLPATWEISEVSMPWIVFFPFAFTLTLDAHVKVSLLKDRVSPKARWIFSLFGNLLSFVFLFMITYYSGKRFGESLMMNEEILAAIWIPWWIGKFAMPVGIGFLAIRFLLQFIFDLRRQRYPVDKEADQGEKYYTT
jgi:TRAP-type C4-dicarboxylate transport system permease small subunit